tara:strand:+ start:337 stop:1245 length:909 start_codon:yes stop_codon:yes gene_type:complete
MEQHSLNNLSEKKNQIQDLLQDIFNEYNRMNESKIQNNCEKDLEMRTMIDNIKTLESSEKQKIDEIRSLKKQLCEYETMINDLNSKLETVEEDKQEENRFDMVRIQAKEITEKDREIKRLNGLLNHYKKANDKDNQIDTVLTVVESKNVSEITLQEVIEPVNKETGEVNPNFIYEQESPLSNQNNFVEALESEPSPNGSIDLSIDSGVGQSTNSESVDNNDSQVDNNDSQVDNNDSQVDNNDSQVDKGKLIIVTSKKIKYYAYENEDPQTVYEFNGNKIADKPLGTREKNEKGKYKVQLFSL